MHCMTHGMNNKTATITQLLHKGCTLHPKRHRRGRDSEGISKLSSTGVLTLLILCHSSAIFFFLISIPQAGKSLGCSQV